MYNCLGTLFLCFNFHQRFSYLTDSWHASDFLTLCCFGVFKFFIFYFFTWGKTSQDGEMCLFCADVLFEGNGFWLLFNICKNSVLFHVVPLTFFLITFLCVECSKFWRGVGMRGGKSITLLLCHKQQGRESRQISMGMINRKRSHVPQMTEGSPVSWRRRKGEQRWCTANCRLLVHLLLHS